MVAVLDGQHFLEAACLQDKASSCVERIMSSKDGLPAIHDALRRDLSKGYIQTYATKFLLYISDPGVKALNNGVFLHKILHEIVEPRSFWDALLGYYQRKELDEKAVEAVAWLSLELLSLPTSPAEEVVELIQVIAHEGSLQKSQCPRARGYGYSLEKLVRLLGATGQPGSLEGPGGRHDNDFEAFRDISIYPTRDELLFTKTPYYRLASEVAEVRIEDRTSAHVENQFRLLREDMLGELRSDIQIALGIKKRGRRSATILGKLSLVNVDFRTRFNSEGRVSVLLHCGTGLEPFSALPEKGRKAYLSSNPRFLKHQSFGAFFYNNELLTFGFICKDGRDETNLLQSPPVVEIQMPDVDALRKVLGPLLQNKLLNFALVDTAVFAYEPVLKRLKNIKELPLDACLSNPSGADHVEFQPRPGMQHTITKLKGRVGESSCKISRHPVDNDQLRSIIGALSRPVSAILGPPGKTILCAVR
ncbi:hypothetical protein IMZ48_01340 [Candidatus Bathyarchaeota archaeon]|nr:hypothetical protein [Candidatus Bathyarchaeota archaeon]